jgi:hypothetical protein
MNNFIGVGLPYQIEAIVARTGHCSTLKDCIVICFQTAHTNSSHFLTG